MTIDQIIKVDIAISEAMAIDGGYDTRFESSSLHQNLTSSEVRFFLFSAKGKTSCLSREKTKRGNGKTVPSFFIR